MERDAQPDLASKTNAHLMARRNAAVARGVGNAHAIFAARAENAEVWDVEGKRYIDFAGGIAVLNTGHRHPDVIAAVKAQLELLHAHLFPGDGLRALHRTGRAAQQAGAR